MAGVFISYRRDDSKGFAGALLRDLSSRVGADQVFMDFEDIQGGTDFPQVLEEAVRSSHVLLALIGPSWVDRRDAQGRRRLDDETDFVRKEIAQALQQQIRVIPVLVDGARMPTADELPPELKPLATRNALELSNQRWAEDVARLTDHVREGLYAVGTDRASTARVAPDFFPVPPMGGGLRVFMLACWGFAALFGAVAAGTGFRQFSTDDDRVLPLVFAGFATLWFVIGTLVWGQHRLRVRKARRLMAMGKPIATTFSGVEQDTRVAVNNQHPFVVFSEWRNPVSKELVRFRSGPLWQDPTEQARNRMITVVVNPNNFHDYAMDLSFLKHAAKPTAKDL